jgi:hypothetical protein
MDTFLVGKLEVASDTFIEGQMGTARVLRNSIAVPEKASWG